MQETVTAEMQALEQKYGSSLQRMGAYALDHIIVGIAGPVAMGLLFRALIAAGFYGVAALILPDIRPEPADLRSLWGSYSVFDKVRVMAMIVFLPRWLYMTLFHGSKWQATPGKLLLGLKVVAAADGSGLGYGRSALRSLTRGVLYTFTLGVSGFVNLVLLGRGPKRQTLHDRIAGSEVVRAAWLSQISDRRISH